MNRASTPDSPATVWMPLLMSAISDDEGLATPNCVHDPAITDCELEKSESKLIHASVPGQPEVPLPVYCV